MPKYSYTARDENGARRDGTLEALSLEDFYQKLKSRGLFCTSVAEEVSHKLGGEQSFRPSANELALFCRQLGTMLGAGLSLIHTLDVIYQQSGNKKWRAVVQLLYQSVQRGEQFSAALKNFPKAFPPLMIHMFEAGERSGSSDLVAKRLAFHFEKEHKICSDIKGALIYPAFLMAVTLMVLILLLIFVMPTFSVMYSRAGAQLPGLTRFVMGLSAFMVSKWYVPAFILFITVLFIRTLRRNPEFKLRWDKLKLRLPVFGSLYCSVISGRFSRSLSSLISSGLPLLTALELSDKVVGNSYVSRDLSLIRDDIKKGLGFAYSVKKTGSFPPMLVSMIGIGEESGSLESMLLSTADIYDAEAESAVKKMVTLLEPVMILFVACVVGLIVFSMVLPMFGLYSSMG